MSEMYLKEAFIILVDDEPKIHEMIADVFSDSKMGITLKSFYEPYLLVEFLKTQDRVPDLILLDVNFENTGLSGIDIVPIIRQDCPYVPIVLLTGMEGEDIDDVQSYDFIYYIPKPVRPQQLINMVKFYMGTGKKSSQRTSEMSEQLSQYKKLVSSLRTELANVEIASWSKAPEREAKKDFKAFKKVVEIFDSVLTNCQLMESFVNDMEKLFNEDFKLFKKTVNSVISFDLAGAASPGLNIHRYHIAENVFVMHLSRKARLFLYQKQGSDSVRLLRIDPSHDDKTMDRWINENYLRYSQ